jgi:DNA-binding response OmpR family regulator
MRVLVIDDEKNLADTLVWILEKAGHEAKSAYDGASALECVNAFSPDVVISDVIMPGMNGIEVCARIQAQFPECHILLFSGQTATDELVGQAREKGLTWELLAKPMDPEELLAKVASFAEKSDSAGI